MVLVSRGHPIDYRVIVHSCATTRGLEDNGRHVWAIWFQWFCHRCHGRLKPLGSPMVGSHVAPNSGSGSIRALTRWLTLAGSSPSVPPLLYQKWHQGSSWRGSSSSDVREEVLRGGSPWGFFRQSSPTYDAALKARDTLYRSLCFMRCPSWAGGDPMIIVTSGISGPITCSTRCLCLWLRSQWS
jgi:hypothetical protein